MSHNWCTALLPEVISDLSTALAKGLYSQGEVLDITYDVVTGFADSDGKTDILAWVISYEDDSNHLKRHTYIQSKLCASLEDAYLSLIQALRCLMTGDMG